MRDEIADRKGVEEVLRESEQRYQLLADNVSDVIWTRRLDLSLSVSSIDLSGTRVLQGTIADVTARVRAEKERQSLESQLRRS